MLLIQRIRTFKKMKDLIGQRELLQLSMEIANNRIEISKINLAGSVITC